MIARHILGTHTYFRTAPLFERLTLKVVRNEVRAKHDKESAYSLNEEATASHFVNLVLNHKLIG